MPAAADQATLNVAMHGGATLTTIPTAVSASPTLAIDHCCSAATAAPSPTATPIPIPPGIVEPIMPGIFFTKDFIAWNEQNLRECDFKHIIIIDKHIQELYYPANNFKLIAQLPHSFGLDFDDYDIGGNDRLPANGAAAAAAVAGDILKLGADFETIVLNFGQESFLSNVLPNCYRAVRFIRKVQKSSAKLLIIDCNGGEQKCVTIVVAYLMYKHNSSFREAFSRLKQFYGKADLDRFYANQLYEYEPILQVQRASACGHSCSRALRAALSKRKLNNHQDVYENGIIYHNDCNANQVVVDSNGNDNGNYKHVTAYEDANMLFNPLTQFKPYKDENAVIAGGCVEEQEQQQQQQQRHASMLYQANQQQQQNAAFTYGITGTYALNSNNNNNSNNNKSKQARVLDNVTTHICDNEDVAME